MRVNLPKARGFPGRIDQSVSALDEQKSDEKKIKDRTENRSTTVGWRAFDEEKKVRSSKKAHGGSAIENAEAGSIAELSCQTDERTD